MSTVRRSVVALVAAALLVALALPAFATGGGEKGKKLYIPVISKGFQHQFWQTVKMGSEDAAKKYGVDITFEGPPTEADIQPQVQMLVNAGVGVLLTGRVGPKAGDALKAAGVTVVEIGAECTVEEAWTNNKKSLPK